jgi:uncharacterized membrane protein
MAVQSIKDKPYDLEPNVEAALSYMLFIFSGLAVYMVEKDDKFVRFHATQSILFSIASFALWSMANALVIIYVGVFLAPLVSFGVFAVWLYLMWNAYNGKEYKLPYIGKIAKDHIYKSS